MFKTIINELSEYLFSWMEKSKLSRLRIFYQILIIIAVMILFIFIQWFVSLSINKTMQHYNLKFFQNTTNRFSYLSTIKTYAEQIEKEYLKVLTNRSSITNLINSEGFSGIINIKDEMLPAARGLSEVDPVIADKISAKIVAILDVTNSPIDEENYAKLADNVHQIKLLANQMNENIIRSSLEAMDSSSQFANASRINAIIIALISAFFSVLIGIAVVASISKPLKEIEVAAKSLAVGDLSRHVSTSGCPEVNEVVNGLNLAINGLRELVNKINDESDILLNSSKDLKGATIEMGKSSTEVAKAMEELARASSEQTNQINDAVKTINLLSELVNKVSLDMEYMSMSSQQVAESAVIGQQTSQDVTNEINELYDSILQVAKVINDFSDTSSEINEITAVIHSVAEQTTLLALNASIEAARAGEHGKGFGVVARETGLLAVQSEDAASRISELISKMNERIDNAVEVMQKSTEKAKIGKTLALEATVTFEYIFKMLGSSLSQIEAVALSTKRMAESNAKAIDAISTIAAISEENMASTQEVSATAEEQSARTQEVIALAENLTRIADNLKDSVAIFEFKQKDTNAG